MPTNEISLSEIKTILISKGIFSKDDPKLDEVVKLLFEYLKSLISPIKVTQSKLEEQTLVTTKVKNPKEDAIINIYRLVLGREPSVNDLTYLSSINIQEEVLLRRMVDSIEHAEIVKARQEILISRIGYNAIRRQLEDVSVNLKDKDAILSNMQNILEQKNATYEELTTKHEVVTKKLNEFTIVSEKVNNITLVDRILDWFNKRFG